MAVVLVDHPLVQRDLTVLRDRGTGRVEFRAAMRRVARALALRALADVRCKDLAIQTPLEPTQGRVLDESVAIVPILRAGLGLADGFLDVLPEARVCHLGMMRDEHTHRPTTYLSKVEVLSASERVFLLDPMLATGRSAVAALDILRDKGVARPTLVCILAAPEGLELLERRHPNAPVFLAAVDRTLDNHAFIRPGLGDAGDRLFDH